MNETGKPSSWAISGTCWCAPTRYGETFSSTAPAWEASFERPAGAGHPREPVDDDGVRVDRARDRREREQRRGRVAPGVRDQAAGLGDELGQPVDPVAEPLGARVREAVPLVVAARRRAGDARRRGRRRHPGRDLVDRRRGLVREAEDRHVRLVRERLGVRDEVRACRRAVEPRVERARGLARERVRADGDELELRVPEHAVERLLPRVPGRADDADVCHDCIVCISALFLCGSAVLRRRRFPLATPHGFRHASVTDALPRRPRVRQRSAPCR